MTEVGNLAVRLSIDSAAFEQSMSSIERNLKAMGQEIRGNNNLGRDWGNSVAGLTTKQDALSRMLDGQGTKVERLRVAYERSKAETGENSAATENLAVQLNRAQSEYNRTETELAQVTAALQRQADELRLSQSRWTQLSEHMRTVGATMQDVGKKMTDIGKEMSKKVTAPIVAMGTLAVKSAIDFESAFAGVRKTVDATEEEFQVLSDGIRNMAKEIPAAATEIAGVAEAAGQLGIKKEAILGFTRTMVDLGVATNMSSEEAATALARLANITSMNQQDFDKLGSSIVDLGNNFATTEGEIVNMALRLAGAGSQVGMSEADILGLSAALSSVGIEAEMGGSAISKAIIRMSVASTSGFTGLKDVLGKTGLTVRDLQMMASHSGKAFGNLAEDLGMTKKELTGLLNAGVDLENFAKIAGMTGEEFKNAFETDAVGALGAFINGLGNAEKAGDSAITMLQEMGISEVRLRDSLLRAGNASELFAEAVETSNTAWDENIALTNEAEQRYKTTASQLQIMVNYLKDLGITIGAIILPFINDLIGKLKPLIEKFANMSESTQKTILVIAGLAAAIGPLLVVGGVLVSSLGAILTAVGTVSGAIAVVTTGVASAVPAVSALAGIFTVLTGPVGLIIAALALVTTGVILLVKHLSKDAIPEVERFGEGVSEATQEALGAFFEMSDGISQSLVELRITGSKVTEDMKNDIVGKYDQMHAQILAGMEKRHTDEVAQMESMFLNTSVLTDKEKEDILAKKQSQYDTEIEILEAKRKSVTEILENAAKENRALTEREKIVINNINEQAKTDAVKVLSESEMEQKIILEKMKDSAETLSAQQAAAVIKNSIEARMKTVDEAEKQYDETYAAIVRMRDETGELTEEQATRMIAEAKRARDETIKHAENMHEEIIKGAEEHSKGILRLVDEETGEVLTKWGVFKKDFTELKTDLWKVATKYWKLIVEKVKDSTDEIVKDGGTFETLLSTLWARTLDTMNEDAKAKMLLIKKIITDKWGEIKTFLQEIDLSEIGKDIIMGLVKGINDKINAVTGAIKAITTGIKNVFAKEMKTASPSKVMIEGGQDIGDGIAIGITSTKTTNEKAIKGVTDVISKVTQKNTEDIIKIGTEAEKKRTEIQEEYAKKRAELARKTAQSSQNALKTSKDKKGKIVTTGSDKVYKIQQDASSKLIKLNEDEQKKLTSVNNKAWSDMQKKEAEVTKARLESVKLFIEDKKSLEQLSLVEEALIWQESVNLFDEGTKEKVEAQKAYKKAVETVNKELTDINKKHSDDMQKINDELSKQIQTLNDEYNNAYSSRVGAILNFSGIFDEFVSKFEGSGQDLITNLQSQVTGLEEWRTVLESLWGKVDDQALMEELEALGPKAVGELKMLNSLSEPELAKYVDLYNQKFSLAREQANRELSGMKKDTEQRIDELRRSANTELGKLEVEWVRKIESITKATDDELKSLKQIGVNAGQGLLNGLASMEDSLVDKARDMANAISNAMEKALQINSPSLVTTKIGEFVGAGLIKGIGSQIKFVANAGKRLASAAIQPVGDYAVPSSVSGNSNSNGVRASSTTNNNGGNTYNVTIDAKNVKEFNDIVTLVKGIPQAHNAH